VITPNPCRDVSRASPQGRHDIEMDEPTSTRRAARKAKGGRRRLATEWVVIPLIIVLVFVLVFGLRFLVG
jgi:hypothetical protein